jgi:hypothetical protein
MGVGRVQPYPRISSKKVGLSIFDRLARYTLFENKKYFERIILPEGGIIWQK